MIPECRKAGEHLGDLALLVAVLGQRALHGRYDAAGFVSPKFPAAQTFAHFPDPSWTTWRAGNAAACFLADVAIMGPPNLSISTADDFCQQLMT